MTEILDFPTSGDVTRGAILAQGAAPELAAVGVFSRVTFVASLGCHRELGRLRPHVAIAALHFKVASVKLELSGRVIEGLHNFPLLRHVTALASEVRPVRIGMTSLARLGGEMKLAERTRQKGFGQG